MRGGKQMKGRKKEKVKDGEVERGRKMEKEKERGRNKCEREK